MRMSKRLRQELESALEYLVSDRPYASPDAESKIVHMLGYGIADGEQIPLEKWFSTQAKS